MAKQPEERFADGASLARALRDLLRRRWIGRAAAAAAAVLLVGAAVAVGAWMSRPLEVQATLRGETRAADQRFVPVAVGEETILRAGDRFWIAELEVTRDAWLSVLFLDSGGDLERIFPAEGEAVAVRLDSGTSYRFPPGDAKWVLDREVGTETVFLAVSRSSLPPEEMAGVLGRAGAGAERLASAAPRLRGIEGVTEAATGREEQEAEVQRILEERFPVVRRHAFQHR
jgi:hypothetical protein